MYEQRDTYVPTSGPESTTLVTEIEAMGGGDSHRVVYSFNMFC